jgi:hypothetical protein
MAMTARLMKAAPADARARPRIERVSLMVREVADRIQNMPASPFRLRLQLELNSIADSIVDLAMRLPDRRPSPPPLTGNRLP